MSGLTGAVRSFVFPLRNGAACLSVQNNKCLSEISALGVLPGRNLFASVSIGGFSALPVLAFCQFGCFRRFLFAGFAVFDQGFRCKNMKTLIFFIE